MQKRSFSLLMLTISVSFVAVALASYTAAFAINIPVLSTSPATPQITSTPQGASADLQATLSEIIGRVRARQPADTAFSSAQTGMGLHFKSQVMTLSDGKARIDTANGSIIRLGAQTLFTLEEEKRQESGDLVARVRLELGKLWVILSGGGLEVETPGGVAAVRGSYMSVAVIPGSSVIFVTCLEGNCKIKNDAGEIDLVAGETAVIIGTGIPPQRGRMNDNDVNEWLSYNPEATLVLPQLSATAGALPAVTSGPPPTPFIEATQFYQTMVAITPVAQISPPVQPSPQIRPSFAAPTYVPWPPLPDDDNPPPGPPPPPPAPGPNSPTAFSNVVGNTSNITGLADCVKAYSVDVTDTDGIAWVKLQYRVLPDAWNPAKNHALTFISGIHWSVNTHINTEDNTGADQVEWRFWSQDNGGIDAYSAVFTFSDSANCGRTYSTSISGPSGAVLSCQNIFGVDLTDPDGLDKVTTQFSATSSSYDNANIMGNGVEFLPAPASATHYVQNVLMQAPFATTAGQPIYYRFAAKDILGKIRFFPDSGGDFNAYAPAPICP